MKIDLHIHSRVSDGTDSPTAVVVAAAQRGLDVIALTDHDTLDGVAEAQEAGRRLGVRVVVGLEMSTHVDGVQVHLLGYGLNPRNRNLLAELALTRQARLARVPRIVQKLQDLGLKITVEDVAARAVAVPTLGRPHVADALVHLGVVRNRDEAFSRFLSDDAPAYVGYEAPALPDAIGLIHGAGGAAVLAHPWARASRHVLDTPTIERLAREHGLDGVEVDHQDHDDATRELLGELVDRLGLIRVGSSDYHGIGKPRHHLGAHLTAPSAFAALTARVRARGGTM